MPNHHAPRHDGSTSLVVAAITVLGAVLVLLAFATSTLFGLWVVLIGVPISWAFVGFAVVAYEDERLLAETRALRAARIANLTDPAPECDGDL